MFTIRCALDDNDRENLIDPLGEVWISDGVSTIRDPSGFLDAWLDSLIGELEELQAGRPVVIDVSEPTELRLLRTGETVRIEYNNVTVFASSVAEFKSALRTAARDFVYQIDQIRTDTNDPAFPLIREYAEEIEGDESGSPQQSYSES